MTLSAQTLNHIVFLVFITGMVVAVCFMIIYYVMYGVHNDSAHYPYGTTPLQKMMGTKEGREELSKLLHASTMRRMAVPIPICITCEGYGKLGHESKIIDGHVTEVTRNEICPDCGGTGLNGGTSYVNVHCTDCNGRGYHLPEGEVEKKGMAYPKCSFCGGTGIVKIEKGDSNE